MDRCGDGTAPRRRRLPAAERRETIVLGAAEVFAQAGYRAAKVSDVAARVGVSEPVIFQNFGSKAALFAAVAERAAAQVKASLDDLAAGFGSASGLLAHVLTGGGHGRPRIAGSSPEYRLSEVTGNTSFLTRSFQVHVLARQLIPLAAWRARTTDSVAVSKPSPRRTACTSRDR